MNKKQEEPKANEVKTFLIPSSSIEIKDTFYISTNSETKPSKEQIINQAFEFHAQGNISEAAKLYQYFINQGFSDYRVFSNYGTILKDIGKHQEAERSIRKSIELNPHIFNSYFLLASILIGQKRLQEAEQSLRQTIELKPDFFQAHLNLGAVLKDLGKLQEAELSTRKAIELKPSYVNAYFQLAYLFQARGNYKNSNNTFRHILDLNTTNINDKFKVLGQLHLNSLIEGKFDQFDQFDKIMKNYAKQLNKKLNQFNEDNFIIKLGLELKDQKEITNYSNLAYIGDSHCLSFSHQITMLKSKKRKLIPVYIR